jgi:alkanesulfonate monooxygenase SsuD/methylene tetrahydromethanopterin reductase-like flavin-dependent oxidoreductase (luciferase family)
MSSRGKDDYAAASAMPRGGVFAMKFAHMAHVWGKRGMTPQQRYGQLWRELELCDDLGFDYGFSVEHHFTPMESWMSAPNLYTAAAGARTRNLRLGAMGHVVALHHPVRLLEEIAIADQMLGGRLEVGLVPGILPHYFGPFGVEFQTRREVTLEFARFMKVAFAATGPVDFAGKHIKQTQLQLSVDPVQRPHPPMWMETRDRATLEFCAQEGLHTGYFFLFPRSEAKSRYAPYLKGWRDNGFPGTPNIAYSTVVYVDETDEKALAIAREDAGQAYKGFFSYSDDPAEIRDKQLETADYFKQRGEPGAVEIILNMLDPDYLLEHELVLIGSPETVARQLRSWAAEGSFNTFFGEFNFGNLAEADLLRSIRMFGEKVIPQLRGFEPF